MRNLFFGAILAASITSGSFSATPATAQDYGRYYDRGYHDRDFSEADYDDYSYHYRDERRAYRHRDVQRRRCSSGTTGTILGAVAGGLLGGEIGRGSSYRSRSTTGIIVGAGLGALAGREIDGGNCRR